MADNAITGVVGISLSGAEQGTYTFIDDSSGKSLTLGNGVTTQTIDMGVLLDAGRVAQGTKVIANFDRLGLEVLLAGEGALRNNGAGVYVAGELDGETIVVAEAEGGAFQVGPTTAEADQIAFNLPDMRGSGDLLDLDEVFSAVRSAPESPSARSIRPSLRWRRSAARSVLC